MSAGTRILLIRHATTDRVGKALSGWLPGIPLDAPGKIQAEGLVQRLKSVHIHQIYSSPIQRAMETASPLAKARNLEIQSAPGLGEVNFGNWQGQSIASLEGDAQFELFNSHRSCTRAPGGELMLETQARMVATLLEIRERHIAQTVAVFSHADAIKSAVMHALGMPIDFHHRLEIEPVSVTILHFFPEIVRVIRMNTLVDI